MTKVENRLVSDSGAPRPAFAGVPSHDIQAARSRRPELPRSGSNLVWKIGGFVVALGLITVASHFIGGAAGRWSERQGTVDAATWPASEGSSRDTKATTMGMDVKKMEARLKLWRTQIDELTVKAGEAGPQASLDYLQRIDDLKAKCALTQSKLDKVKTARP